MTLHDGELELVFWRIAEWRVQREEVGDLEALRELEDRLDVARQSVADSTMRVLRSQVRAEVEGSAPSAPDSDIIQPPILVQRDEAAGEEGVAYHEHQNALLVFRSADEVAKFRERTGQYEGFEAIPVDEVDIARTCIRHGFSQVCLPQSWTGENAVEFFDAEDFVKMLKDSALEE